MEDYQFYMIVGSVIAIGLAIIAFLWKISSDYRKADAARHKEVQGFMNDLRMEMHQMRIDLSEDIHELGERVVRVEGRLDEKESWRRTEELVQ